MSDAQKTVITLICERACDINDIVDASGNCTEVPGMKVVKFPCSGMIQPLMIQKAIESGAEGVVVTGCQIGDCYYREGNRMIRERLLGERQPGLKKNVDRRRVIAFWLAKPQRQRFIADSKEFIATLKDLPEPEKK